MEYVTRIVLLFCFSFFLSEADGRRQWQIVPDHAQPEPVDLLQPVEPEVRVTYNDEKTKTTAIHDADINACFLTNYDPEWNLTEEEKIKTTRTLTGEKIKSPIEFLRLKAKVGDVISSMCKRRRLYWMKRPQTPPKLRPDHIQHGSHEHEPIHHGSHEHDQIHHGSHEHEPIHHGSHEHEPIHHGSHEHGPIHHGSHEHDQPQRQHKPVHSGEHGIPHPQHHHAHPFGPHDTDTPVPVPERYYVPFKRTMHKVIDVTPVKDVDVTTPPKPDV